MQRLNLIFALTILVLFASSNMRGDNPPKVGIPTAYTWTVIPCDSWTCMAAALAAGNGEKYMVMSPTNSRTYGWVILRRVVSGSYYLPPDAPFLLEPFDAIDDAVARFNSIDRELVPMMTTVPDGKVLVVYLRNPEGRRHAATR